MIHKISIENFFSIADAQEIDFTVPKNAPDLPCFVTSRGDAEKRLPVVAGFFGANASGKTTALRSIVSVLSYVIASFSLKPDDMIPYFDAYASVDWLHKPTKISIEFDCPLPTGEKEYLFKYQIHISRHDTEEFGVGRFVEYESLSYAPHGKWRNVFERKAQTYRFGKEFGLSDSDPRLVTIRPNASILSTLAQFNHPESLAFLNYIATTRTNLFGFGMANDDPEVVVKFYRQNPDFLKSLNKEIRRADVGIKEISIGEGPQGAFFIFHHDGLSRPLFFMNESNGTQQFIRMFPRIKNALDTGSLAVIDELDSVLHTTLIAEIFRWFSDPVKNPAKAQLLFTAHNPTILDFMEKEQVFLTEKKSPKTTNIYGLKDIKGLRREPSLAKKYLSGELGGLPFIG